MERPLRNAKVETLAPAGEKLTIYDEQHVITYLRMLDANAEAADWREVCEIVLHLDPGPDPEHARRVYVSHLARALWMTEHGYRQLLRGGASNPFL